MSYIKEFNKALGKIEQQDPKYAELLEEETYTPPDVGITDKLKEGQVETKLTADDDLQKIAAKHKIPVERIRDMATVLGGAREWAEDEDTMDAVGDTLLSLVGVANTAGFQVPSWIAKKLSDENTQKAYDDIRKLVDSNKGLGQTVLEGLLPTGAIGAGGKLATKVLGSAAQGAATGLASSDVGREAEGAAAGAMISGLLSGAFSKEAVAKMKDVGTFKKILTKFTRHETVTKQLPEGKTLEAQTEILKEIKEAGLLSKLNEYSAARTAAYKGDKDNYNKILEALDDSDKKLLDKYYMTAKAEDFRDLFMQRKYRTAVGYEPSESAKEALRDNRGVNISAQKDRDPFTAVMPESKQSTNFRVTDEGNVIQTSSLGAVQLHEFAHQQKAAIAASLPVIDPVTLIQYELDKKINSLMSENTREALTKVIKASNYDPSAVDTEMESWLQSLLVDKGSRNILKGELWKDAAADTSAKQIEEKLNSIMSVMTKDAKKIKAWKESVTSDDLIEEFELTRETDPLWLKSVFEAAGKAGKPRDIAAMNSPVFGGGAAAVVEELKDMSVKDIIKTVPGAELKAGKKNGLEVFEIMIDGKSLGSRMSEAGARDSLLKYLKELKNKSEVDFSRR